MRGRDSDKGSLVIGQVRWPASNHRWIDDRSKVWPDESITGSDIISSEIGHLKSSGNCVVISFLSLQSTLHERERERERERSMSFLGHTFYTRWRFWACGIRMRRRLKDQKALQVWQISLHEQRARGYLGYFAVPSLFNSLGICRWLWPAKHGIGEFLFKEGEGYHFCQTFLLMTKKALFSAKLFHPWQKKSLVFSWCFGRGNLGNSVCCATVHWIMWELRERGYRYVLIGLVPTQTGKRLPLRAHRACTHTHGILCFIGKIIQCSCLHHCLD